MTYRELKEQIEKLTPEQLDEQVKVIDETGMYNIGKLWCLEDDYINPSGEGIEPRSMYVEGGDGYDPEYDFSEEPIILTKGTILLSAE